MKEINQNYFGYKLIINDWYNPKFKTPTGNEKKNKVKKNISKIKNFIYEYKNYSETIPVKTQPENNYTKKKFINKKVENNNNLKFNNKLKSKNINQSPKFITQEVNSISTQPNKIKIKPEKNNALKKNMRSNYSSESINNVNFNNYKKIQVNTNSLYPKDSFKIKKNNIYINGKESQSNLILKTELNESINTKQKKYREIIKINYQNNPKYNNPSNNSNRTIISNSVNKYKINNNLIQFNTTTKKKNYININTSQPNLKTVYPVKTIKEMNDNINYSYLNNNTEPFNNNIFYFPYKNEINGNNYYNFSNNNIYINHIQNIYN